MRGVVVEIVSVALLTTIVVIVAAIVYAFIAEFSGKGTIRRTR